MKISTTLQPLLDAARRDLPSLLKQLEAGRLIQAQVIAQPKAGLLQLRIGSTELLARSEVSARAGTELKLEVIKGPPLPELRVIRPATAKEIQQRLARSAMLQQLSPTETRLSIDHLKTLAKTPAQLETLQQFARILHQAGVPLERLGAGPLREALNHSGLFHEARLLATRTSTGRAAVAPTDTKTQLLQFAALLRASLGQTGLAQTTGSRPTLRAELPVANERSAPALAAREPGGDTLLSRLARLVEASVSRIQLQQSIALPIDEGPRQAWQIDLPLHLPEQTDDLELRIERDAETGATDGSPGWSVNLNFQFDSIGRLHCRLALSGDRVATTFWCDRSPTLHRLEARLPVLEEAFAAQGLEVVHLKGVLGEPSEPVMKSPLPVTLLDERV